MSRTPTASRCRKGAWAAASALSFAAFPADALPQPTGAQFQVNTYSTGRQTWPAVAAAPDGGFAVVWQSDGSVGDDTLFTSLQGQRHAPDGTPLGAQFQVNTRTTGDTTHPAVAVAPNGDFIVVWQATGSFGTDSSSWGIQGQRYASDGNRQGTQFQVNTYWTGYQGEPSVAVAANGDFVVAWTSSGSSGGDTSEFSVQGQRYASDGTPQGAQFQVNTYTTDWQRAPRVAASADGDFVVVWTHSDASYNSWVRGRRFASDGAAQGNDFVVAIASFDPSVASDAVGNFVVVWDGSVGIRGQRFGANGSAQGVQFQVETGGNGYLPSATAAYDGDFAVVWHSWGSPGTDTSDASVQGRRFASDGSAQGTQFQVNTYTTSRQSYASVAAVPISDDFVVVWMSTGSYGSDTDQTSIQGQRYLPEPSSAPGLAAMIATAAALARRRTAVGAALVETIDLRSRVIPGG